MRSIDAAATTALGSRRGLKLVPVFADDRRVEADPAADLEPIDPVPAADRPARVQMVWTGLNGARYVQSFDGFAATCAQHELDHLDGVVTFDHLDAATRADLIAEYQAA